MNELIPGKDHDCSSRVCLGLFCFVWFLYLPLQSVPESAGGQPAVDSGKTRLEAIRKNRNGKHRSVKALGGGGKPAASAQEELIPVLKY